MLPAILNLKTLIMMVKLMMMTEHLSAARIQNLLTVIILNLTYKNFDLEYFYRRRVMAIKYLITGVHLQFGPAL